MYDDLVLAAPAVEGIRAKRGETDRERHRAISYAVVSLGLIVGFLVLRGVTWRGTATAIVLTSAGAHALHRGQLRREVRWSELERIERVETFGNVRWKLIERGGEHLSIEGEIADIPALIARASELSGVAVEGG